jgi:GT2 family glycosyltransferase
VDDDIIAHPSWLRAMLDAFADADVGMVAGKVVPQWEGPRPAWLGQFRPGYLSLLDLGSERLELKWPRSAFGCNMAVRRSAVFEVGGFNPDAIGDRKLIWFRGDGETGLTRKVYDVGYKVLYDPDAWVYHRIGASRLEPRYFCWRSFLQGISESYTDIRQRRSRRGLIRLAGRGFVNAGRCFVSWLRRPGNKKVKADAWYWYARAKHQLRTVLSPKLYRHVLTESYL